MQGNFCTVNDYAEKVDLSIQVESGKKIGSSGALLFIYLFIYFLEIIKQQFF